MNRSLSLTAKLSILIILALIFGTTMVTLSIRRGESRSSEHGIYMGISDQDIEKKFNVQPDGDLRIDADEGEVRITGTDSNEVSVHVLMRGDRDRVDQYHVNITQDGNTVRIEGRADRRHFRFWEDGSLDVKFEISVPKKFNLDLQTAGGNLVLRTVEGTINGTTSGGDLDVMDIKGRVKLETSGGDVLIKNAEGDLNFVTSGGNIDGSDIAGDLVTETSGGNIDLKNVDAKLRASTSGGNIEVSASSNKGVTLETSGGNVRVRMPNSISADVDASATGGDVDCSLQFSGKIKDGDMHGTINGGGNMIRARTSGGNIYISAAY
ncbi:MAG: DUF4097 family beta strand repeat-containing protein [Bacteroidota bacterium]